MRGRAWPCPIHRQARHGRAPCRRRLPRRCGRCIVRPSIQLRITEWTRAFIVFNSEFLNKALILLKAFVQNFMKITFCYIFE
ncbi:Cell division protein ftsQ [Rhodovastum atsumiense]|nr:Cell division protein ftsQ [Rhodovastum atsumiense]